MLVWGISALNHDASISVVKDSEIMFAGHSERYSGQKFDPYLNDGIIQDALQYGKPDIIAWSDKHSIKNLRKLIYGQKTCVNPKKYLSQFFTKVPPIRYYRHHKCHAANGFFTSPYKHAAIVVIDAIGEWDTISIWEGKGSNLDLKFKVSYPHSLGLLYSAFTKRVGYKPMSDEYIVMGMSAYGEPKYVDLIEEEFFESSYYLKKNVHIGINNWLPEAKIEDLAASIQKLTRNKVIDIVKMAKSLINSENLIYTGGVALNCEINRYLFNVYKNIWFNPNPGDAGNSLGAAGLVFGNLNWQTPYLGSNIDTKINVYEVVDNLSKGQIVGIMHGRTEFGPRALGNRSILADPRKIIVKDKVNEIKQRQKFRPFAPVIMEEDCFDVFDLPVRSSPYMQIIGICKKHNEYPSICHVDNTSRVQTVTWLQNKVLYDILKYYKQNTGCEVLLNTSLNLKGYTMLNRCSDITQFSNKDIRIFGYDI